MGARWSMGGGGWQAAVVVRITLTRRVSEEVIPLAVGYETFLVSRVASAQWHSLCHSLRERYGASRRFFAWKHNPDYRRLAPCRST